MQKDTYTNSIITRKVYLSRRQPPWFIKKKIKGLKAINSRYDNVIPS